MDDVLIAKTVPYVPVAGSDARFYVHRIYCVGQNYAAHAKEMGNTGRELPFFFMKPADAVLPVKRGETGRMPYPPQTANLHHEVEVVVAIGQGGKNISVDKAAEHIWGYAIGLDMTRRDLQAAAKEKGRPWCTAKGFDDSAPISEIHPAASVGGLGSIALKVNQEIRQQGEVADMIWNIAEIVAELSRFYTLQAGDLIFTGTPAGVGAVQAGDVLEADIAGLGSLRVQIAAQ